MLGNKDVMAKNILKYMEINRKNATDVCRDLGFKQNTFSDWVNAKAYPRIDKIEMMANYFGVTKAHLVEDLSTLEAQGAEDAYIISLYRQLSPANREVVRTTINALLTAQKNG